MTGPPSLIAGVDIKDLSPSKVSTHRPAAPGGACGRSDRTAYTPNADCTTHIRLPITLSCDPPYSVGLNTKAESKTIRFNMQIQCLKFTAGGRERPPGGSSHSHGKCHSRDSDGARKSMGPFWLILRVKTPMLAVGLVTTRGCWCCAGAGVARDGVSLLHRCMFGSQNQAAL